MIEFIGAIGIVVGMLCLAVWVDDGGLKFSLFIGILGVMGGIFLIIIPTKPEPEKPTYSFEWVDEETKCHFYGGKLINCESVRIE